MTTANMKMVTIEVQLKEGEEEPKPQLDEGEFGSNLACGSAPIFAAWKLPASLFELSLTSRTTGEHIEVRVTPLKELYAHLQAYEKLGYHVDARLHAYGEPRHLRDLHHTAS